MPSPRALLPALIAPLALLASGWTGGTRAGRGEEHWAYVAPVRPALPDDPFGGWARNPIDLFVGARLAAEGLAPSPEADRVTLIRRLSLDLLGLPPSPEEVDAFVADDAADAYERLVDRLLASPHYGEHLARRWLDLARYADSDGYEKDELREMWRYRDWVIEAFASDMPFDRFTIEQLAGDLLPDPTLDQRIATGFHRNTMVNKEGGTDPEEWRVAAVKDRVNTTANVWLGTTLQCAQCHSHKFDPFSQEEYYELYAFFDQTEDTGNEHAPVIEAPLREERERKAGLEEEEAELERRLGEQTPELDAELARWEGTWRRAAGAWRTLRPAHAAGREGTRLAVLDDDSVLALGDVADKDVYEVTASAGPGTVRALRLEVLTDPSLPGGGPGRPSHGNFVLNELVASVHGPDGVARPLSFARVRADHFQTDRPWLPAEVVDGDFTSGWAIAPGQGHAHQLVLELAEPLVITAPAELSFELHQDYGYQHLIGRFRLSVTEAAPPSLDPVPAPELEPLIALGAGDRTPADEESLASFYRAHAASLDPVRARLAEIRGEMHYPSAMVMRERAERRVTHLMVKGNFLDPGREVEPGVPAVLNPLEPRRSGVPADRLDLARWLVAPENPLTARVTVNRYWQMVFGTGIVATDNDFGTQGEPPSHPELLDWLALELQDRGWSVKSLLRTIVTSATYRQTSLVSSELLERDPGNRLLARGPRVRVDAETVRDIALAASGMLCPVIGGPSVFPPQPEGIWMQTYSGDRWTESEGCDRYRRGLYTLLRRTSPYPTYMLFDATSREVVCTRRAVSDTPLQALALLNDPAFVELAGGLARRMMTEGGATPEERATRGFRLCVSRAPEPDELALLVDLYRNEYEAFAARDAAGAGALLAGFSDGEELDPLELAAWTVVANALLNLDETITKG